VHPAEGFFVHLDLRDALLLRLIRREAAGNLALGLGELVEQVGRDGEEVAAARSSICPAFLKLAPITWVG
jgi:hypothetical protein